MILFVAFFTVFRRNFCDMSYHFQTTRPRANLRRAKRRNVKIQLHTETPYLKTLLSITCVTVCVPNLMWECFFVTQSCPGIVYDLFGVFNFT